VLSALGNHDPPVSAYAKLFGFWCLSRRRTSLNNPYGQTLRPAVRQVINCDGDVTTMRPCSPYSPGGSPRCYTPLTGSTCLALGSLILF
jgi:hypothetical protein